MGLMRAEPKPQQAHQSTQCPQKHALTPDDEVDILASRVAHVVDSAAVVEATISGSDRSQEEHWPPDLSTEGQGARVA